MCRQRIEIKGKVKTDRKNSHDSGTNPSVVAVVSLEQALFVKFDPKFTVFSLEICFFEINNVSNVPCRQLSPNVVGMVVPEAVSCIFSSHVCKG